MPPQAGAPPWAELRVGPEPPKKAAEPGPPRSVIQLLAGSFNSIAPNSSSRCLVVVSARWKSCGLRCFLAEFVAVPCARHGGHEPEEGSAAPGCAGSSGTAGLIIHLPNFGVPRHTPHAAARCLGFKEVSGIIFFLKNGVSVVFERLSSCQGDRLQSSVRRAG